MTVLQVFSMCWCFCSFSMSEPELQQAMGVYVYVRAVYDCFNILVALKALRIV